MKTRTGDRAHLIYRLRVYEEGGAMLGHMVDLTGDGIMVVGAAPVAVGTRISLRMDLPKNVMSEAQILFGAECRWCRKRPSDDYYGIGFKIKSLRPDGIALLRSLSREYCQEFGEDEDPEAAMNPPLTSP